MQPGLDVESTLSILRYASRETSLLESDTIIILVCVAFLIEMTNTIICEDGSLHHSRDIYDGVTVTNELKKNTMSV